MNGQRPDIAGLRQDLDEVDSGIVRLIAQRHDIITAIAEVKEHGAAGIQDAERERQVLDGVAAAAADLGVSASLVRRIFRELISDSVAQQARRLNGEPGGRVRVAFQGVAHAYSDAAAQKYLAGRGLDGDLTGYRTFREAAGALLAGQADLAVLPIENTTAGSINEVYALLREHELYIVGEETWKVDHCLAGVADVPLTSLTRILSHPQGLEQCSQFLLSVPQAAPTSYFDTAEAVRAVAEAGRSGHRGRHRLGRRGRRLRPGRAAAQHLRPDRQLHPVRGPVRRPRPRSTCASRARPASSWSPATRKAPCCAAWRCCRAAATR